MYTSPLVSIVIPVLNGEQHIEACIGSILNQTYENFEIVISNNFSEDRTAEIIRSFTDPRIRLLPEVTEMLSLHENWTRALASARGELIKIVCHDDLLLPECLSIQTALLLQHPDCALAVGRRHIIDDTGKILIRARGLRRMVGSGGGKKVSGSDVARLCVRAGTNLFGEPACVLIRRSALPEPLFDSRWRYTIDIEFYMRCLKDDEAITDKRVLCSFRVSHRQLSAAIADIQVTELRSLFAELKVRYPGAVTTNDVRRGAIRAQLLTIARRTLYLKMRFSAASIDFLRGMRHFHNSNSKGTMES